MTVAFSSNTSTQFNLAGALVGAFTGGQVGGSGGNSAAITSTQGYNSSTSETLNTSNTITVTASRVAEMGDFDISYCGSEEFSANFPNPIFGDKHYQDMPHEHTLLNFYNEILDWY